jgi:hypothetical protein
MIGQSEHIPLVVHGHQIDFYIFIDAPHARSTIAGLKPYFERMPPQHLAVLYPIFVTERKPAGAAGGGTWRPAQVRAEFMGHERNTQVPDIKTEALVVSPGKGLIGIPRERWMRDRPVDTVLHEVGHCIDYTLHIVQDGDNLNTFQGVRYHKPRVGEYAAEAYARYILYPHRVCRADSIPAGENQTRCTNRLAGVLRASPAFRDVPRTWSPI